MQEFNLDIDKYALDSECVSLPAQIIAAGEYLADKQQEADVAKSQRDVATADVELLIRNSPTEYLGAVKVTESTIAAALCQQASIIEARMVRFNAAHAVSVAHAAVNALNSKRSMLESLVKLHGQGYFSEVRMNKPTGDIMTDNKEGRAYGKTKGKVTRLATRK